jgi:hypothetical protein
MLCSAVLRVSCFLLLSVAITPVHAAILAHWEADDTAGTGGANSANVTTVAPSIVASAVTRVGGGNAITTPVGGSGSTLSGTPVFRDASWDNANSLTSDYYAFNIDVTGANTMDLTSVTFYLAHSGGSRTAQYQLSYSTDGTNFTPTSTPVTFTNSTFAQVTQSLSLTNLTDTVFFRLAFGSTMSSDSSIGVDDIQINGTVSAIPEPVSCAALGLLGLGYWLRRRRSM